VGCSDVDNIDIGVLHKFLVRTVGFGGGRGANIFEELFGAGFARRTGCCDNRVDDGINLAGFGIDEKIFCERLSNAAGGKNAPADGLGFRGHYFMF
jgi:hypothetical protein